jgi:hypothetical protein
MIYLSIKGEKRLKWRRTRFSVPGFLFHDSVFSQPTVCVTPRSRVGRFWMKTLFWMRVPLESIHFYVKIPKTGENNRGRIIFFFLLKKTQKFPKFHLFLTNFFGAFWYLCKWIILRHLIPINPMVWKNVIPCTGWPMCSMTFPQVISWPKPFFLQFYVLFHEIQQISTIFILTSTHPSI